MAQIYRTWQDKAGQKWVNACWYYRPEQTVHSFEKHFYENEVIKTGQYRDHRIEEIVDRCFVMFVTRYNKGRPRGFPADKEVYVCESRYNDEKHKLARIKTWASAVPDEVREKDYEMDLFPAPRKLRKIPSPIKHLLRDDAKAGDPLPKPTWGAPNAPPLVGAVHCRERDVNVSTSTGRPAARRAPRVSFQFLLLPHHPSIRKLAPAFANAYRALSIPRPGFPASCWQTGPYVLLTRLSSRNPPRRSLRLCPRQRQSAARP